MRRQLLLVCATGAWSGTLVRRCSPGLLQGRRRRNHCDLGSWSIRIVLRARLTARHSR